MITLSRPSNNPYPKRKGFSAKAKTVLIYGIISILLHGLVLSSPVLAGTETDEFAKALVSPENQPKFNFELADVQSKPNPVRSGQATIITASFLELQTKAAENLSSPIDEAKLTIKGCATCGFGSPQGFANLDRKDGYVQIGSSGKTSPSTGVDVQKADSTALRCNAIINAPDGSEAARVSMLHSTAGKYVGIWSAKVSPGIYKVSIVASASGNAETFVDVLEIVVLA